MKHRNILVSSTLVFVAGLAMLALSRQEAQGMRFSDASLRGTYHFNLVEIRALGAGVDYCDSFGTLTFDGAGNAVGSSTRNCSSTGSATSSGPFTYLVMPSGDFGLTEVGSVEVTHGQILQNRKLLLIDGTTRTDLFVQNGVMARR